VPASTPGQHRIEIEAPVTPEGKENMSEGLRLYNTLTRSKEPFVPLDPDNVRMYVCGPTVYDFAHIGNARPVIVFDVLFRLLRHLAGQGVWDGGKGGTKVTYVRNITDVDDKINARALRDFGAEIAAGTLSLNAAIRKVTEKTADQFHADVKALGCLEPTAEPRATEYIPEMRALIDRLVERGVAYVAEDHVLFSPKAMNARPGLRYGSLSKRPFDEMLAGARVDVASYKRDEMDFVLWKPSKPGEPGWPSPASIAADGRPGWHIECSAMSMAKLLEPFGGGLSCDDPTKNTFDIHGGGIDLVFPHHENEVAQSCCALGTEAMASVWMHNGFVQVEGRKMSKSEGNFVTIHDLLHTDAFGGRKWPGPVLRLAMLMTHYREPIDFSVRRLEEAEFVLKRLSEAAHERTERRVDRVLDGELYHRMLDDLDTSGLISALNMHSKRTKISPRETYTLYKYTKLLGLKFEKPRMAYLADKASNLLYEIQKLTDEQRENLKILGKTRPFYKSGRLRPEAELMSALTALSMFTKERVGIQSTPVVRKKLRDELAHQRDVKSKSTQRILTFLEFLSTSRSKDSAVEAAVKKRLALIAQKNWPEADRIRDELLAQGIQLKDGKDPATGERITTWEVKR
jgi:cysteinyl-tRNA synthetase